MADDAADEKEAARRRSDLLRRAFEGGDPDAEEELVAAATAWLEEKWSGDRGTCPYCLHDHWYVQKPGVLDSYIDRSLDFPVFPVTCTNCGNTVFIALGTAGFLEDYQESPEDAAGDGP